MKKIKCFICKKPIESSKKLLVDSISLFSIKPFHSACFYNSYYFKSFWSGYWGAINRVSGTPFNHKNSLLYLALFLPLGLVSLYLGLLILQDTKFGSVFLFLTGLYFIYLAFGRVYSYYKFEKPLKERTK